MYIYLDIVTSFACEMCGACCRNDWLVTLNEDSYRRNAELFIGTGRSEEFAKAFIPLSVNNSLGEYAYIAKQGDGGGCWFLAENQRCRLQGEAGHNHLDVVCQTFPRYPMNTMRGTEITLSFSCPAVIKLASRRPLAIIRSAEPPIIITPDNEVVHVYPQQQPEGNPLRYYFELEQHFIDIMQCRKITINERLQIIKDTVKVINGLAKNSAQGQQLNKIIYGNYELLDATIVVEQSPETAMSEILLENFFVNFIFKKPFYIYGLERTMQLLENIWQRIDTARKDVNDSTADETQIRSIIMEVEFQYSHHRNALFA